MNTEKIKLLSERLDKLLRSNSMNFDEIKKIDEKGVYAIYNRKGLIYIGKSKKRGVKNRMSELIGDFRSHTLNRKTLFPLLRSDLRWDVDNMKKKEVYSRIDSMGKEEREKLQIKVNNLIKEGFKIKFIPLQDKEIESFEHFAIGVMSPKFND